MQPTELTRDTVAWFGLGVLHIVEGCTDGTPGPDGHKADWHLRKSAYLDHLGEVCGPVLVMSRRGQTPQRTVHRRGPEHGGGRGLGPVEEGPRGVALVLPVSRSCIPGEACPPPALIDELERTVAEMEQLAGG